MTQWLKFVNQGGIPAIQSIAVNTNGTVTTKYRVYLYPITSGAQIAYKNVTVKRG